MNAMSHSLRARNAIPRALTRALQWRLLLLWVGASLLCALVASLPVWNWLADALNYTIDAPAIANGTAPLPLLETLMAPTSPMAVLRESTAVAGLLMLLLSPLLVGAGLVAARAPRAPAFGELLRGAVGEYGPLLRLLLWSVLPLGLALLLTGMMIGANEKAHDHAILASEIERGRYIALAIGGMLLMLAHAGLEAGRGWLAADARLRSALKAWWRGMRLLRRRPLAVLAAYLLPTLCSLLLALLLLAVRQTLDASALGGFLLAALLGCAIASALAWGKLARLFALKALAEDAHNRR